MSEPLTVSDLAERVSLSPSAFSHLFREVTGKSPYQFVKEMRLNRARELLVEGEAERHAGFPGGRLRSTSHFINEFRSRFGATPRAYSDLRSLREEFGSPHGTGDGRCPRAPPGPVQSGLSRPVAVRPASSLGQRGGRGRVLSGVKGSVHHDVRLPKGRRSSRTGRRCGSSRSSSSHGALSAKPTWASSTLVKPVTRRPAKSQLPSGPVAGSSAAGPWQTAATGLPAASKAATSPPNSVRHRQILHRPVPARARTRGRSRRHRRCPGRRARRARRRSVEVGAEPLTRFGRTAVHLGAEARLVGRGDRLRPASRSRCRSRRRGRCGAARPVPRARSRTGAGCRRRVSSGPSRTPRTVRVSWNDSFCRK